MDASNLNNEMAKLATTASVLVNSAASNSNINDMLQKNTKFSSTFGNTRVKGLLEKQEGEGRVKRSLLRRMPRKKDFKVLSNEMLGEIGDGDDGEVPFSLFQGFSAVLPQVDETISNVKEMSGKLLENGTRGSVLGGRKSEKVDEITVEKIASCQNKKMLSEYTSNINYYLDLMEIRKGLGKSEINEIDEKIDRLFLRRKEISDDIQYYEKKEKELEMRLLEIKDRLEFIKDVTSEPAPTEEPEEQEEEYVTVEPYSRVTTTSPPTPGQEIHTLQAHSESINCIAFDEPYGKLLTCSIDNTVKVWNMTNYTCVGLLEGHNASVGCVTIDKDLAFTGSHDATIKLWNLNDVGNSPLVTSFEGHMDTISAISYSNGELVSGSEDKTIRQWDVQTGHLVQTMDIMWASSMANLPTLGNTYAGVHPYISSLQVFDAALATGTNDGIVRLWDLRSGEIIRQLFGHMGPVTTLQFDKSFNLITGSVDKSVRVWDLRNGAVMESFSYEGSIKKLRFDDAKVVSVVDGESGVRIYERQEDRHWKVGGEGAVTTDVWFQGGYLAESCDDGVVKVWNV